MPGKLILSVLLFCFTSVAVCAQKNLRTATLVLNNGDTSKGYIDFKEWLTIPSSFLFTTDKDKPVNRLSVSEVSYFELNGVDKFYRYTVTMSMDNDASSVTDRDTTTKTATVFLKLLQKGKNITLLSYRDDLKNRFYILDKDETSPAELLNSTYLLNGQIVEDKQYRQALLVKANKYTPGQGSLVPEINEAGYYSDVLENICRQINGLEKSAVTSSTKSFNRRAWRFSIGGGMQQGALKVSGANRFAGENTHPFYAPLVVIGADLAINPSVRKLIVRGQIHATSYKTDAYKFLDYGQYTEEYWFNFRMINIAFEPQLLYNIYNKNNLKWFVSAGVGMNFSSYPENSYRVLRTSSSNAEATNNNYINSLKTVRMTAMVSTGINISRMEADLVYIPKNSITSTPSSGIDNTSLQFRLSFFIKK